MAISKRKVRVRAPGRVNLIGGHTDYTGGWVLPVAIDREIQIEATANPRGQVEIYSAHLNSTISFPLDHIVKASGWGDYVKGVARELISQDYDIGGFTASLTSSIPIGGGLSSSAALEIGIATVFDRLFDLHLDPTEAVRICQRAENEFVGVRCGIMDQFASQFGRKGNAILLNCGGLRYEYVPLPPGLRIVVVDTGIKRSLADTPYEQRREEVEMASSIIGPLGQLTREEYQQLEQGLSPTLRKRVEHVIAENERVLKAATALKKGDVDVVGELMYRSHQSLRDRYEVSVPQLDRLVEISRPVRGVVGARMTGAGFGGCVVCLVWAGGVEPLIKTIKEHYGETPTHVCRAADGAGLI